MSVPYCSFQHSQKKRGERLRVQTNTLSAKVRSHTPFPGAVCVSVFLLLFLFLCSMLVVPQIPFWTFSSQSYVWKTDTQSHTMPLISLPPFPPHFYLLSFGGNMAFRAGITHERWCRLDLPTLGEDDKISYMNMHITTEKMQCTLKLETLNPMRDTS